MIRVCVVGASGRMGGLLRSAIKSANDMTLAGAVVSPKESDRIANDSEVPFTSDLRSGMSSADLVLDFSTPEISLPVVEAAAERGIPLVLGTTGHSPAQREALEAVALTAPLLVAPNTSIGMYALAELARLARSILGDPFDVEIFELHHNRKIDAPSGTARHLVQVIGGEGVDRSSGGVRSHGSVGVASLRGGDVPGEHTVFLIGPSERLELTHRVRDRAVFAEGALWLGRQILSLPAGRYGLGDVLRRANHP